MTATRAGDALRGRRRPVTFFRFVLPALCFVVRTFTIGGEARADEAESHPRSATLEYVVPADQRCPDESSFRNRVGARLGVDPFVAQSATSVSIRIHARANGLIGSVELRQSGRASRSREMPTTEGCEALVSALAATVALALDPMGEAARATPPSASSPDPAPEPPPPLPSPPPVAPSMEAPAAPRGQRALEPAAPSAPSPRLVPLAALGVTPAVGLAPSATIGAELGVGLKRGSLALLVQARVDTMMSTTTLDIPADVDLTLLGLGLLPCGSAGRFRICGVVRAGTAQGRASGTNQSAPRGSAFALVGVRPGVLLPVSAFVALSAELEVGATIARTQLLLNGRDVWTAPPIFASGILGAVIAFGDGS